MARLNIVDPATATGKAKELFDGPLKGKHLNIFKGMANNGGVFEAVLGFMGGVKGGALTGEDHEIIALVTGKTNSCDYCMAAHTAIATGAKVPNDVIEGAKNLQIGDAKKQALVDFTQAVINTKGHVSDDQLNTFKGAGYDDAAVVEVIGGIAVNTFTNFFNHVNATEIDEAFKPVAV